MVTSPTCALRQVSLASLHEKDGLVRRALMDPLLAEAFPETKRLHDLKTGSTLPPGGVDASAGLHAFEVSSEVSRGAGRRLLLAHPKPQEPTRSRYLPLLSVTHHRYVTLLTVACRPRAVMYRHVPSRTVTYRYLTLRTVT